MKNLLKICALLTCCITSLRLHGADTDVPVHTTIDVQELVDGLSLDDMLIILSAGKLKALTMRPDITEKLMLLEDKMDEAFQEALSKMRTLVALTDEQLLGLELAFKQKMVIALYASLYTKAQALVEESGTHEQQIIFADQLTPEQLQELI